MKSFSARIYKIGINPYVFLPPEVLKYLFERANKNNGPIPVYILINDEKFIQHLVKYSGKWRLYLNTPMRKAANKDVGDEIDIIIDYDVEERVTPVHAKFAAALKKNRLASNAFNDLTPSRQKEILRYINNLKSEEAIDKNVNRAINFLLNKDGFVGRSKK